MTKDNKSKDLCPIMIHTTSPHDINTYCFLTIGLKDGTTIATYAPDLYALNNIRHIQIIKENTIVVILKEPIVYEPIVNNGQDEPASNNEFVKLSESLRKLSYILRVDFIKVDEGLPVAYRSELNHQLRIAFNKALDVQQPDYYLGASDSFYAQLKHWLDLKDRIRCLDLM